MQLGTELAKSGSKVGKTYTRSMSSTSCSNSAVIDHISDSDFDDGSSRSTSSVDGGLLESPSVVINEDPLKPNGLVQPLDNNVPKHNTDRSRDDDLVVLSALYAKLVVVLGVALPLAEVLSPTIPTAFYTGFYLFLYCGSIIFLIYAYVFLRNRNESWAVLFRWIYAKKSTPKEPDQSEEAKAKSDVEGVPSLNVENRGVPVIQRPGNNCGSFYLRVGAIAFGIGSMIYSGLEFVRFLEMDPHSSCYNILNALDPIARMAFTFAQLYFIFLNSKMNICKYRRAARFGLMHMLATNLCVWLYMVIQESKYEILRLADPSILEDHDPSHQLTTANSLNDSATEASVYSINSSYLPSAVKGPSRLDCRRMQVLGQLVHNISPLLFPCTIQYSLICAAICYTMWNNINRRPGHTHPGVNNNNNVSHSRRSHHHYRVDCTSSIRGLFSGILVLVLAIISVILYYVFITMPDYKDVAIREAHISETAIYLLTFPVPLVAMVRIRHFRHNENHNEELNNILLIFAQVGVYLFSIFSMISSTMKKDSTSLIVFSASFTRLLQATFQTMFILDASHRTARNSAQAHKRPGRELITFLMVCNFAMWVISTLETERADSHPLQLSFFGFWGWTIISRFSSPLAIFFRLHSTVCLCEIWKKLYKVRNS